MSAHQARLTKGPVGKHLIDMTIPVFFGVFTMMLQGFADAFFIGMVGDWELAALSFAYPILMIVMSVAIGLGAGTSSVVARAIGANDSTRAARLATDSLLLSFIITGSISFLGILTIDSLFLSLGAPKEMIPLIRGYMEILYLGVPFVVVGMVGMSSMRATGDTRLPSLLMIIASIANIIIDPIMIFGLGPIPAMGLKGAAMAALIARGAIFLGTIYFMNQRLNMLSYEKPTLSEMKASWIDILHVGIPAAATNTIIPIATAIITAMLAKYGPEAVAGFGVASRIESVVLVMFYSLSAIIGPFVGQNLSAKKSERIYLALKQCSVFCLIFGLIFSYFLIAFRNSLPLLFSQNVTVINSASLFLLIAPISYGAYGVVMTMNAAFNGMGKPVPAVAISLIRMIVIYIPMAYFLQYFLGMSGIYLSYAIANILSGVVAYNWAKYSVSGQIERV